MPGEITPDPGAGAAPTPTPSEPTPTPGEPTEFDRVMADLEDNDDIDTKQIMDQTGAKDVKPDSADVKAEQVEPEPGVKPDPDAKPGEPVPKVEDGAKPDDAKVQDGEARLAKLRAQGRHVGEGRYQVNQGQAELKQQQAEFAQERAETKALAAEARSIIDNFKRDPIGTAKAAGVDARQMGQQIKHALEHPEAARASTESTEMGARLDRIEQLLTSKNEEQSAADQERAQGEAREAGHQQMKSYMSEDATKTAYPLSSRLLEADFREYSERSVAYLLQNGLDVSQDNVCEVIEASLEKIRSVYTDAPPPTPESSAEPGGPAPQAGQRSAPSLGSGEKTSGQAGTDFDTMSIGDADDPDFLEALHREVASG